MQEPYDADDEEGFCAAFLDDEVGLAREEVVAPSSHGDFVRWVKDNKARTTSHRGRRRTSPPLASIGGVSHDDNEGWSDIFFLPDDIQADCEWTAPPAGVPGVSGGGSTWHKRSPAALEPEMRVLRARVARMVGELREIRLAVMEYPPKKRPGPKAAVYLPSAPVLSSLSPAIDKSCCVCYRCRPSVPAVGGNNVWRPSLRGGGGDDEDEDEDVEDTAAVPTTTWSSASAAPQRPDTPLPPELLNRASRPSSHLPISQGHFPGTLDPVDTAISTVTQAQREKAPEIWLRKATLEGYDKPSALSMAEKYRSGEKDRKIPAMLAQAAEEVARRAQEDEDLAMALALREVEVEAENEKNDREVEGVLAQIRGRQRNAVGKRKKDKKKGKKVRQSVAEVAAELEHEIEEIGPQEVTTEPCSSITDFDTALGFLDFARQYGLVDADDPKRLWGEHAESKLVEEFESRSLSAAERASGEYYLQLFTYNEEDPFLRYANSPRRHRIRRRATSEDVRRSVREDPSLSLDVDTVRDDAPLIEEVTSALERTLLDGDSARDNAGGLSCASATSCCAAATGVKEMVRIVERQAEHIKHLQTELDKER